MDLISHTLWTAALAKGTSFKIKKKLSWAAATFFGIFPDMIAFTPLYAFLFINLFIGKYKFPLTLPDQLEPAHYDTFLIFDITTLIYNLSHSLIVFFLFAALISIYKRRIYWEITGWLFHILIDIPTHSYSLYPTPFLFPLSDWKHNGIAWENPYLLIVNYVLLIFIYYWFKAILLRYKSTKIK